MERYCETHTDRQYEFLCSACNQLICSKCIVSQHNGHRLEDYGTIAAREGELKGQLERLWRQWRDYDDMIKSSAKNEQTIKNAFADLYNYLAMEEARLARPYSLEKAVLEGKANKVLTEVDMILQIVDEIEQNNLATARQNGTLDVEERDDGKLVHRLSHAEIALAMSKHSSLDEYLNHRRLALSGTHGRDELDLEFLRMFHEYTRYANEKGFVPVQVKPLSCEFKYSLEALEKVLKEMRNVYEFSHINQPFVNVNSVQYIFSLGGGAVAGGPARALEIYDVASDRWRKGEDMREDRPHVYTRGSVQFLDRVDRYDVVTSEFRQVGRLKQARYNCFSFASDRNVFVVGGFGATFGPLTDIEVFNVDTQQSQIIEVALPTDAYTSICGVCFDSREFIYMLTSDGDFFRLSISTNQVVQLRAPPPVGTTGVSLLFGFSKGFKVFCVGGYEEYRSVYYDIELGIWIPMAQKTRTSTYHSLVGINIAMPIKSVK
eukprot:gene11952-13928_t